MDTINKNGLQLKSLESMEDKWFGPVGSAEREQSDLALQIELLSEAIRQTRKSRHLTQAELGKLVGVGKAQISKLESNPSNVTFETVMKVFSALGAKVKFKVEMEGMPELGFQR